MWSRLWDFVVESLIVFCLPTICSYHLLTTDLFLNVSAVDATGFEKAGNVLLVPVQYLFAGKMALPQTDGSWTFVQKFDYRDGFWIKTGASMITVLPSLALGSAVKGLSYLSPSGRKRHALFYAAQKNTSCHPNLDLYRQWGIPIGNPNHVDRLISQGYKRRPGDEHFLKDAKLLLAEVAAKFNESQIPWWTDCGTCLGTYRYGGIIPWDDDIDIGILVADFENARRALNRLDPRRFEVQDWSGRSFPNTFFKVFEKISGSMLDIFCFKIDLEKRELSSIFSLEESIFFPEWVKIRERLFSTPVSFDSVFPLKKASFDGIEVFVPNRTKEYLQRLYGENLDPARIYDPNTGRFEKDLSHPYWKNPYVH